MDKYDILKKYFGYDTFRDGQELLIDSLQNGRDVLGIMPTGAGKSLCYQVPALLLPGVTLVISPLISLMKDQVQALNQAGIHAAYINSSLTEGQIKKALQLAAGGQYKIIYVAPERLETYDFLQFAVNADISLLSVDEAHCISQWGQDFRPSYQNIVQFIRKLPHRPTLGAFTATATEKVKEDIACVLGLEEPKILVTGFDRKNLYFAVETPKNKNNRVLQYVRSHEGESGIIYCATRKNVELVYEMLQAEGISVTKYHAGLGNEERKQNQDDFIYDRKPVMAATNAFGMGIDKSNVRYVLHYNMPQSLENYYQEAGRAGRDGEPSECVLLYSAQDLVINRYLLDNKEQRTQIDFEQQASIRERDDERLRIMNHYCTTKNCLRDFILRYFGESGQGRCENCSNCRKEFEELDATEDAKKVIQCIREMRRSYGINVVAGTLHGDSRAKLREYRVSEYASYASLKHLTEGAIKELISQMLMEGLLMQTPDKYALLKTTSKADEVLSGNQAVLVKKSKEETLQIESDIVISNRKQRRSEILTTNGLQLFDELRELRMELAREESVPPYLIFSDKTLVDMCVRLPLTKEEMLGVSGVGENKYNKYGQRFLARIGQFAGGKKQKLYYGELEEALSDAGNASRRGPKAEFFLTPEQAEGFPYKERCLQTELAVAMSGLRDPARVKKVSGADIFRFLQAQGLADEKLVDGFHKKIVSDEGAKAGLFLGPRMSQKGTEYEDIYFSERAQKMVVEHYVKK